MKKILIPLLLLTLITLPSLLPFFNSKFFYTQDYIFIARLHQMSTALSSGQFPVRWAPDLRFGEPLFNFYAPLPYYLGSAIRLLGFDYITIAKILFVLSSLLSSITMYIFCRKLFNQRASYLAVALYTFAPYRAVDIYVRGALSEAWAFVFFPLIFYASLRIAEKRSFLNLSILSLSLAALFLTHNVTTLIFLPFLGLWWIYLVLTKANWKLVLPFVGSLVLSLGLAAFFLLPALYERQFIQTKYLLVGYFDFRAHFVAFYQFFSTFWGYGSSLWGPKDDMSFQVGVINWAILALALFVGIVHKKDEQSSSTNKKLLGFLSFLGFSFVISIFMQHNKSAFVWEALPILAFIQFPWRFLAVSIFIVSITGAVVADYFKNRFTFLYFILIAAVLVVNFQYFRPRNYVENNFFDKFLQVESMRRGIDLTKDYLPIWVETVDGEVFNTLRANTGEIEISGLQRGPTFLSTSLKVISDSLIEAPITYFPGWEVWVNDRPIPRSSPSKMGLIRFELPYGEYKIKIELKDTPIRTVGNMISLGSLVLIGVMLWYRRYKQ